MSFLPVEFNFDNLASEDLMMHVAMPATTWTIPFDCMSGVMASCTTAKEDEKFYEPDIKEIKEIFDNDGYPRGVKVIFKDGTFEKSICADDDIYSFEVGIGICLFKWYLSRWGRGSTLFNRLMDNALKVHKKNIKEAEEASKKEEAIKAKKEKIRARKQRREERKRQREREEKIEIQKEAYLRALEEREKGMMVKADGE